MLEKNSQSGNDGNASALLQNKSVGEASDGIEGVSWLERALERAYDGACLAILGQLRLLPAAGDSVEEEDIIADPALVVQRVHVSPHAAARHDSCIQGLWKVHQGGEVMR